jgi:hypothetical protein
MHRYNQKVGLIGLLLGLIILAIGFVTHHPPARWLAGHGDHLGVGDRRLLSPGR